MKKKIFLLMLTIFFAADIAYAQTLGPSGLVPGWYYDSNGDPRYYYENGAYYDPATQSYGGMILYPDAPGPEIIGQNFVPDTPGVPNTGRGGAALKAWLALMISITVAVGGTMYLSRAKIIS